MLTVGFVRKVFQLERDKLDKEDFKEEMIRSRDSRKILYDKLEEVNQSIADVRVDIARYAKNGSRGSS